NITPDDLDTIVEKAVIAQAEGDLPRASALLASLQPAADDTNALETQAYQAILERRPAQIMSRLKDILVKPDPALGFYKGELSFSPGWQCKQEKPIAQSLLCRSFYRHLTQDRSVRALLLLLHCSDSIQCSIRCGMIRASQRSSKKRKSQLGQLYPRNRLL